MLLDNKHVGQLLLPTPSEEPVVAQPLVEASPITMVFAVIVTIIVIITTIAVFLKAPKTIATTGKTVTTKAASSALPLVARGKKLTTAKQQRLTANLIKLMKLLFVVLPVAIGCIGFFLQPPLPLEIIMFVSSILAIGALLWFCAQYSAARLLAVDLKLLV